MVKSIKKQNAHARKLPLNQIKTSEASKPFLFGNLHTWKCCDKTQWFANRLKQNRPRRGIEWKLSQNIKQLNPNEVWEIAKKVLKWKQKASKWHWKLEKKMVLKSVIFYNYKNCFEVNIMFKKQFINCATIFKSRREIVKQCQLVVK